MAPWEGVKRAQRKSAGRAIVKANKDTDVGFKNASQAVLTAFKGSTCGFSSFVLSQDGWLCR